MGDVLKLVQSVKDLPTGPKILPKLFQILDDENSTIEEIGDLIAFEPALTAKLLKFCNSAYFGRADPVQSVPEAISMVGFSALRPMMTSVCSSNTFVLPASCQVDAEGLWKHSLLTAFGCKFVAEGASQNSDMLFTAGLLHDVGRVVLARSKGAEYGQLLAQARAEKLPATVSENFTYGFSHADVSACLLQTWQFPDNIVECVRFHHVPHTAATPKAAACVYLGNTLATALENPLAIENLPPGELDQVQHLLDVTNEDLALYSQKIIENMNFVNAML